jgi:hypothetical protein
VGSVALEVLSPPPPRFRRPSACPRPGDAVEAGSCQPGSVSGREMRISETLGAKSGPELRPGLPDLYGKLLRLYLGASHGLMAGAWEKRLPGQACLAQPMGSGPTIATTVPRSRPSHISAREITLLKRSLSVRCRAEVVITQTPRTHARRMILIS